MAYGRQLSRTGIALGFMIGFQTLLCCVSLVYAARFHGNFHIYYDPDRLFGAIALVAAFSLVASLFMFARFSFGYVVSYYFYAMIAGFLWINYFIDLNYDHRLAGLSAVVSAFAFFLPALLITSPIRQVWTVSPGGFDRLLICILLLCAATILVAASYNFRIPGLGNLEEFREELIHARIRSELTSPTLVNYAVSITSSVLLPFAFAAFIVRNRYWHAAAVLILLLLYFPITLSKFSLFTPAWLVFIALLTRIFESRIAAVLSLLLPMLAGLASVVSAEKASLLYDFLDFRLMAIPSNALAIYSDFFSQHSLTYFCHIRPLKPLIACPYADQLGVVMERAYGYGNFNASLFATEGVASVGIILAPLAALASGLAIALANRLSAGLPHRFVLTSGALLPLFLLNVPLSVALITHGAAVLFLLWYITPRDVLPVAASVVTK
jgi:hypothetical protein